MKLEFPKVPTETSRVFENENFSLGDMRVIMELLSSKIYSRPKYIIVQEVASNARDANREANKAHVPITIKLPNRLDDNFTITDSGIGISPSRMSDVFLKYGNSTKRDGNGQTGGFGIGAKTPFTYTDTFTVVTTTLDEDGVTRQRTYIAHKTDNGFAKMSLVTTKDIPNGETGTSISFAVAPDDFSDFEYATKEALRFWNPQPKITGISNWHWPVEKPVHSGTGWELTDAREGSAIVLIDHIPYALRLNTIFKDDNYCITSRVLKNSCIRLYFNTGEVDVSATREDLDYKDRTIKTIKDRCELVVAELTDKVGKLIVGSTSLWDATINWRAASIGAKNLLLTPKWNGKDLLPDEISVGYRVNADLITPGANKNDSFRPDEYIKITVFEQDGTQIVSKKSGWNRKTVTRVIRTQRNVMVILDDEGKSRPNNLRLQTVFETNPTISEIAVVSFKQDKVIAEKIANVNMHWSEIPHTVLSTIPKAKNPNVGSNGKAYTINAVKQLDKSYSALKWTGDSTRAPEDTKGGVYILIKNGKPTDSEGLEISKSRVDRLGRLLKCDTIYGILYKYRKKISSSWEELSAKAILTAGELRRTKEVENLIEYGETDFGDEIGDSVAQILKNNLILIKDPEIVEILRQSSLVNSGEDSYGLYKNILSACGIIPESPKNSLRTKISKLYASGSYPCLFKWQNITSYHDSKSIKNVINNELIFYLNAKYDATQGVNNGNT